MMEVGEAKQLKELQKENARLKRMLADEMLGKEILNEALEKKAVSLGHKRQIAERLASGRSVYRKGGLPPSRYRIGSPFLPGEAS